MAKRPKIKTFSFAGWDARHYQQTQQYVDAVDKLFKAATDDITARAAKVDYDPNKPFTFDDYPRLKAQVDAIVTNLTSQMITVVGTASRNQWLFACQKNDAFLESILQTSKLKKSRLQKYQDRNLDALKTFQTRKVDGMDLSKRVWKYTRQFKDQIEVGLDAGLGEGRSAQQLSRDVRQNLQEPNRLFRRVRDKRGNLQLSKAAQSFHPGQGVYRSSYKNAMRLTRSEINMAYRQSDWMRWQNLDFVSGYEIHRSNHEPQCKCEICESLQGIYPKWFKFVGWHPQCLCYCTAILQSEKEFNDKEAADLKAAFRGTAKKQMQPSNTVRDVPQQFKDWVDAHVDAQDGWSSTPYFIKDNFKDGLLRNGLKQTPIEPTPEITPIPASNPSKVQTPVSVAKVVQTPNKPAIPTELLDNRDEVAKVLNIKQGEPMSFDDANAMRGNPNHDKNRSYRINCQSCVVANYLRRLGFDVEARPNTGYGCKPYELSHDTNLIWIDPKTGNHPQRTVWDSSAFSRKSIKAQIAAKDWVNEQTKDTGMYHLTYRWKVGRSTGGHIITAERLKDGTLRIYDPQNGKIYDLDKDVLSDLNYNAWHGETLLIQRIDGLLVDTKMIDGIVLKK